MATTQRISRSPSDYRATPHFGQRRREREIPGEAIRECITDGDRKRRDNNEGICLEAEWSGIRYWVALIPPSQSEDEKGKAKSCGRKG